ACINLDIQCSLKHPTNADIHLNYNFFIKILNFVILNKTIYFLKKKKNISLNQPLKPTPTRLELQTFTSKPNPHHNHQTHRIYSTINHPFSTKNKTSTQLNTKRHTAISAYTTTTIHTDLIEITS
ncbi:hypothetical protein CFOL_v3_24553, partial [Cephalotus follicularis]